MYYKSLLVFVLCTIFVAGFVVVLSYDTAGVGRQSQIIISSQTTCSSGASCEMLSMTSASLRTVNYTDELGVVNYATLVLGLRASGSVTITGVRLFIGNASAGYVQGPFEPGVNRVLNVTVPSTVSVSSGKTYVVSAEGFYSGGTVVWASMKVKAS